MMQPPIQRPSIQRRLYWGFAWISSASLILMMGIALLAFEDLEESMLKLDLAEETSFLLQHMDIQHRQDWQTASLTGVYLPANAQDKTLPELFQNRPVPFAKEVHQGEQTFLMSIQATANGELFIAKDISLFERRENLFVAILLASVLLLMGMSFLFARFSAKRIVQPLTQLADQIELAQPNQKMPHLSLGWQDRELQQIARSFNRFMQALENFMHREQQLLSMASHELRTPIAVISGAIEILQQRQSLQSTLQESDKKILQRIAIASDEMRTNVDILLRLARSHSTELDQQPVWIDSIIQQVVDDFILSGMESGRLKINLIELMLPINASLFKMLVRNLVQNALQHSEAQPVIVQLYLDHLLIADQGTGLSLEQQQRLLNQQAACPSQGMSAQGVGLYIVSLICQRLGFGLQVSAEQGTCIKIFFNSSVNSH